MTESRRLDDIRYEIELKERQIVMIEKKISADQELASELRTTVQHLKVQLERATGLEPSV